MIVVGQMRRILLLFFIFMGYQQLSAGNVLFSGFEEDENFEESEKRITDTSGISADIWWLLLVRQLGSEQVVIAYLDALVSDALFGFYVDFESEEILAGIIINNVSKAKALADTLLEPRDLKRKPLTKQEKQKYLQLFLSLSPEALREDLAYYL